MIEQVQASENQVPLKNNKTKVIFISLGVFLIILLATLIIWFILSSNNSTKNTNDIVPTITPTTISTIVPTESQTDNVSVSSTPIANDVLHTNKLYPYTIRVPKSFKIDSHAEESCGTVFTSSTQLKLFTICSFNADNYETYVAKMKTQATECPNCKTFLAEGVKTINGYKANYIKTLEKDAYGKFDHVQIEVYINHVLPDTTDESGKSYLTVIATIDMNDRDTGEQSLFNILSTLKITK